MNIFIPYYVLPQNGNVLSIVQKLKLGLMKKNQKYVACFFLLLRFNFVNEIGGLK